LPTAPIRVAGWGCGQQLAKAFVESLLLFVERGQTRFGSTDGLLFALVSSPPASSARSSALRVALGLELFGFGDRRPPFLVQLPELFQAGTRAARCQAAATASRLFRTYERSSISLHASAGWRLFFLFLGLDWFQVFGLEI